MLVYQRVPFSFLVFSLFCYELKEKMILKMRFAYTHGINIWVFPKIGVLQNGWFIRENLIKMDDLEVPLFSETSTPLYSPTFIVDVYPLHAGK